MIDCIYIAYLVGMINACKILAIKNVGKRLYSSLIPIMEKVQDILFNCNMLNWRNVYDDVAIVGYKRDCIINYREIMFVCGLYPM